MAEAVVARRPAPDHVRPGDMSAALVVDIHGLTHRFGRLTAVDHVDLALHPGEIYGFLGRNGAGKTTVIRALLGLLDPSAGTISLFGTPVRGGRTDPRVWGRVGYLVEGPGLYPQLTVDQHLAIMARYRHLSHRETAAIAERLQLTRYLDVPARRLSLGNRQRLGLALAMAHRPSLLVLDEPVNGLDPAGVVEVREVLRELADEGATVLMSSHLVVEVAQLADRVGIIHEGRLVADLSRADLDRTQNAHRLVATFRSPQQATTAATALSAAGLECATADSRVTSDASRAVREPDEVVTRLVRAGAAPMSLTVEHESLEHLFLRLTAGTQPGPVPAAAGVRR
jgi:ABC-2 type transport system ATP-binding protein